jgi:transcriptional regulator with XRE-family HTH domain
MIKLGSKIRDIRESKKLSQEYVAAQLEMSPSGYGKIERDETELTISKAFQISSILEIAVGKLLDIQENSNQENHNNIGVAVQHNQGKLYHFSKEAIDLVVAAKNETISELKNECQQKDSLIKDLLKKLG